MRRRVSGKIVSEKHKGSEMMNEEILQTGTGCINPLNKSLGKFFGDAWKITLKNPAQAYYFFRTVQWQKKAARVRAEQARQGIRVPPMIIYSITDRCNLHCKGCYAQALHTSMISEMDSDKMKETIREARELGVSFMILAGGEPLVRGEIIDIIGEFQDVMFFVFTNGTMIDDTLADRMKRLHNLVPIISLEGHRAETDMRRGGGVYEHLIKVMRRLKQRNIFFGTSITLTSTNFATVTEKNFVRELNGQGCRLFFLSEYTPINEETESWAITDEQANMLPHIVKEFRKNFSALFISVPGDERDFGGCLSAGRGFVHISAQGDLEPCPFAPYSDTNLRELPLKEALRSEFLAAVRESNNHLKEGTGGCALWREREWLRTLLREKQAQKENQTAAAAVTKTL
jgi:MoaA/NifB/PqqE/SkfB family radical SAM enzyme